MVRYLISGRPDSEEAWFNVTPMELRQNMNPDEREFLGDILDVIAEYA